MSKKDTYLIWHRRKGTFTALDKKGRMIMWSSITGEILKQQKNDKTKESPLAKFSVYKAKPDDYSYTKDYNSTELNSLSLIVSDEG
jgi:hypothetical protein